MNPSGATDPRNFEGVEDLGDGALGLYWRSVARLFFPGTLFRVLSMSDVFRWRRVALLLVGFFGVWWLVLASALAVSFAAERFDRGVVLTIAQPDGSVVVDRAPAEHVVDQVEAQAGPVVHNGVGYSVSRQAWFFGEPWDAFGAFVRANEGYAAHVAPWQAMTWVIAPVGLVLLRPTMRSARVSGVHQLRVAVYAVGGFMLAAGAAWLPLVLHAGFFDDSTGLVSAGPIDGGTVVWWTIGAFVAVTAWYWRCLVARFLMIDRPWLVSGAVVLVALLGATLIGELWYGLVQVVAGVEG